MLINKRKYRLFVSDRNYGHCFVEMADGKIYGFGSNNSGQLGIHRNISNEKKKMTAYDSDVFEQPVEVFKEFYGIIQDIIMGYAHTIILTKNNKVYGMGKNELGQLALGHFDNPVHSATLIKTPGIEIIYNIIPGYNHFIWKCSNGIFSNGCNKSGQLGIGNKNNQNTIKKVLKLNFNHIKDIKCGGDCSCFLTFSNQIFMAGYIIESIDFTRNNNRVFPCKINSPEGIRSMYLGGNHMIIIGMSYKVYGKGYNSNSQVIKYTKGNIIDFTHINHLNGRNIKDISAGYWQTCVLLNNGDLYGFGDLDCFGCKDNKNVIKSIKKCKMGSNVCQIQCANSSTYFVKWNGQIYSCGYNSDGRLMLGNKSNSYRQILHVHLVPNIASWNCYGGASLFKAKLLTKVTQDKSYVDVTFKCVY